MVANSSFTKEDKKENIQIYTDYFTLKSSNETFKVYTNFCKVRNFGESQTIENFLHNDEMKYFETLKYKRRINSFLLGRYASKNAVSAFIGEENLKKIHIRNGVFGQPIIDCQSSNKVQVSITHCDDLGAAVAFSNMLLIGIDIEYLGVNKSKVLEVVLTQYEKELLYKVPYSYEKFLVMIWTIKESLSKVLKTGLTVPFNILELEDIQIKNGYCISNFKNFLQYRAISYMVKDYMYSITFPKNVELGIDINRIMGNLYRMV